MVCPAMMVKMSSRKQEKPERMTMVSDDSVMVFTRRATASFLTSILAARATRSSLTMIRSPRSAPTPEPLGKNLGGERYFRTLNFLTPFEVQRQL